MDDVIFVGTPDRPALGRAEVSLTIDNTAGAAADRVLRGHDHPHAVPRRVTPSTRSTARPAACSTSRSCSPTRGIGRQQHVIVGQGQLDAVLNAAPGRPPRHRRGGRRDPEVPQAARARRATAGVHRGQPPPAQRPAPRGAPPAHAAAAPGRRGTAPRRDRRGAARDPAAPRRARDRRPADAHRAAARRACRASRSERPSCASRLRELDVAVLDAEHSLAAMGDDALADALVRVESMRERARGLDALVAEKRRGVERELAAAADEGVRRDARGRRRCAARRARRARRPRSPGSPPGRPTSPAPRPHLRAVDEAVARRRGRRDAVAGARRRARARAHRGPRRDAGAEHVAGVDGVVGPLVDLLEIDARRRGRGGGGAR